MIFTAPIQRRISKIMENDINYKNDPTEFLNAILGEVYNLKTHRRILEDVKKYLDNHIKQSKNQNIDTGLNNFEHYIAYNFNDSIKSNKIQYNGFNGRILVTLSDGILSVVLRFNSISKKLRNSLTNDMSINNVQGLKIYEGSKHTEIGFISREQQIIDNINSDQIFNIILNILTSVGGIQNLK